MKTVLKEIIINGIGIHSGAPVSMVIKPSEKTGIFFKRTDLSDNSPIPATWDNVGATNLRNTTVGDPNGTHVQTIEHIMAALFVTGIDAAIIEINGPETPILDGSAKKFYELFEEKGTKGDENGKRIVIKKEIVARQSELVRKLPMFSRTRLWLYNMITGRKNNGFVRLFPERRGLYIKAELVYKESIIGTQSYEFLFDYTNRAREKFIATIAAARTFGKLSEWEWLKKRGMARGCNEANVIALNGDGTAAANPEPYGLYWPDEFVRHKIIDLIGDIYTSGGQVIGGIESFKGSHALNNLVLRKLFSDPENYEIIEK
ncbi:MAG: UDP-3-O-acyl-N-acetylglucosamine deacetylase [Rickettsiales bacterium]|jgi:UDP-3-O-[3-hydroxymyristoyl] N-acetylglucosamine deacetylase|nr:UDP-3-O-acyl-N-acetylglucosamine deacetylase [Rickettsiales bacterium]